MSHPIYQVQSFEKLGAYTLRVHFNDGAEQVINLSLCWPGSCTVL